MPDWLNIRMRAGFAGAWGSTTNGI